MAKGCDVEKPLDQHSHLFRGCHEWQVREERVAVREATMPNCSLLMSMWSPLGTHFGRHYQLLVRLDRPGRLFFCPSRLSNANFVSLSIWCGVCLHLVAHLVASTGACKVPRNEMVIRNSFASFRKQVLNLNWVLHDLKNKF